MRIGFDVRPFLKRETGVGIYCRNLLSHLAQIDRANEYFLFSSSLKDKFSPQKIPPFPNKEFHHFRFPVRLINLFWYRLSWPPLDYFFKTNLDLAHSPTPLILPTKGKKIVTVYDLFFLDFPLLTDRETRKNFTVRIKDSLLKADGVIAISEFTRNQLLERFPLDEKKVKTIYLGLDPEFHTEVSAAEEEEVRKKFSLPPSFIFFVGAMEPRKNLLRLIEALKITHEKHQKTPLVIVGREGLDYRNLEKKISQLKLQDWVRMMGYLPDEEVKIFYRLASVFAFPSLCEGFGLPVIEAMARGLPVATSKTSALPEVGQDAALYFHPEDPEDIADKLIQALEDEELRQTLKERGKKRALDFDWHTTAAETLSFYEQLFRK
ncbi:MAG: glycosyltransferase [Candidatus Aminicenantes bacterium]|nr:glycosyltransferase [Candidatus Aminicenantes bacterium]